MLPNSFYASITVTPKTVLDFIRKLQDNIPMIKSNQIQNKIPLGYFIEIEKLILKFIWKIKGFRVVKTILKKKNKIGELTLSDLKAYHEARVIKIVCCWHRMNT